MKSEQRRQVLAGVSTLGFLWTDMRFTYYLLEWFDSISKIGIVT